MNTHMMKADCDKLAALWHELLPDFEPSREQLKLWLLKHNYETASFAIAETAAKRLRLGGQMSADHQLRFASKVMIEHSKRESAQ